MIVLAGQTMPVRSLEIGRTTTRRMVVIVVAVVLSAILYIVYIIEIKVFPPLFTISVSRIPVNHVAVSSL